MPDETEPNKSEKGENLTIHILQAVDAQLDDIARDIAEMKAELQQFLFTQERPDPFKAP